MGELRSFERDDFTARAFEDNGEIWFVAKDVFKSLGYKQTSDKHAVRALINLVPEHLKGMKRISTDEGEQEIFCFAEQGLYFFLDCSEKKVSLFYQTWIANEVIPSIKSFSWHGIADAIRQGFFEVDLQTRALKITPKGLCLLARNIDTEEEDF